MSTVTWERTRELGIYKRIGTRGTHISPGRPKRRDHDRLGRCSFDEVSRRRPP